MTLGTRAYIDGNGTLKAALTGSNGTADTTGVTAFDANGNALAIALDGTDAVGIAAPAGAAGIRGWLSGIYQLLTGTLTATLAAGTDVIGAVTQSGAWVLSAGSAVIGGVQLVDSGGTNRASVSPGGAISTADAANGPVSPGAAAARSELVGGVYNATLPALTNGQQVGLQLDLSGRVLSAGTLTTPYVTFVSPAVSVATYPINSCLGGLIHIPNLFPTGKGGTIDWLQIMMGPAISFPSGELWVAVFNQAPTNSTFTDKSSFILPAADMNKLVVWKPVGPSVSGQNDGTIEPWSFTLVQSNTPVIVAGTDVWIGVQVAIAALTTATTSDLVLMFSGRQYSGN